MKMGEKLGRGKSYKEGRCTQGSPTWATHFPGDIFQFLTLAWQERNMTHINGNGSTIGVEIKLPKRKEIMEQRISEYIITKTFANLKMSTNTTNHKERHKIKPRLGTP